MFDCLIYAYTRSEAKRWKMKLEACSVIQKQAPCLNA